MPADDDSFAAMFEAGPRVPRVRSYRVGEVLDLEVVRVTDEAVFLAMDGKHEGVVEANELRSPEGESTVSVGSRLAVRVAEIDRHSGEIRLTPVSAHPLDPTVGEGDAVARAQPGAPVVAGMRVKGKVTGVERYGVFLEFAAAAEEQKPHRGLIPQKELGAPRGADLRKMFPVGKELEAVVMQVDDKKRIRLSVVALQAADERRQYEDFAAQGRKDATARSRDGSGFGTFADLLKRGSR